VSENGRPERRRLLLLLPPPLLPSLLLLWLQRKVNELGNEGNSFEHFVNGKIDWLY
jgi:hypothetical protein